MGILSILKKVLLIGAQTVPAVLSMVNPGLGMIVTTVLNAVLKAEAQIGSGNGAQKAEAAWNLLDVAAPAMVQLIEMQTGKQLADEVLFQEGLHLLQEGQVKVLNAFGLLLPSTTPKV
jgi:hypothetical protein